MHLQKSLQEPFFHQQTHNGHAGRGVADVAVGGLEQGAGLGNGGLHHDGVALDGVLNACFERARVL